MGGKKNTYSLTPYSWWISLFYHHALETFSPSGVLHPTFPHLPTSLKFSRIKHKEKNRGREIVVNSSSALFFLSFFLIKRKRTVVVHENSSVKENSKPP